MKTILSIDDEPALLRCFSDALKSRGYSILTTPDPEEGLTILRENDSIALLLLDVKMPGKNGFEVYEEFRQFKTIPVLFITAYPNAFTSESDTVSDLWEKYFTDGVTDILYKPFDFDTFFEKIEGLIGKPDPPPEKK